MLCLNHPQRATSPWLFQGGCPQYLLPGPVDFCLIWFCFLFAAESIVVLVCYKLVKCSALNFNRNKNQEKLKIF